MLRSTVPLLCAMSPGTAASMRTDGTIWQDGKARAEGPLKGAGVPAMMERGRQGNGGGQGWVKKKKKEKKGKDNVGAHGGMHPPACALK